MTTKHYYQKIYSIYTAELVAYFVVGLLCFLLTWLIGLNIVLAAIITLPFSVLILFSVNRNARLKYRMKKLPEAKEKDLGEDSSPLKDGQYFLGFLPAPTLHMTIFSTEGTMVGVLRDKRENIWMWIAPAFLLIFLPRRYVLLDNQGTVLCEYRSHFGLNGTIDILTAEQEQIGTYKQSTQLGKSSTSHVTNSYGIRQYGGEIQHGSEFIVKQTYNQRNIVHYSSGWLPSYYSQHFLDPNTPSLTFTEGATEDEKRIGYCYCIDYLQQQNH